MLQSILHRRKIKTKEQLERIAWWGSQLPSIPQKFCNNREVVLAAVQQSGSTLRFASERLRKDVDIVVEAAKHSDNDSGLRYAHRDLLNNPKKVRQIVQETGWILQYTTCHNLRSDREFVLVAVKDQGRVLQHASESLRNDRDVVLAAVNQHAWSLQYASDSLRNDRDVVLAAVNQRGLSLRYASDSLRNDRQVVLLAVEQEGSALQWASHELRNDRLVVLGAISNETTAIRYASTHLRNDRDVVLAAVYRNGDALHYASSQCRDNREIVLAAVRKRSSAIQHASKARCNDPMVLAAYLDKSRLDQLPRFSDEHFFDEINERLKRLAGELSSSSPVMRNTAYDSAKCWLREIAQKRIVLPRKLPPESVGQVACFQRGETRIAVELLECSMLLDSIGRRRLLPWQDVLFSGTYFTEAKVERKEASQEIQPTRTGRSDYRHAYKSKTFTRMSRC